MAEEKVPLLPASVRTQPSSKEYLRVVAMSMNEFVMGIQCGLLGGSVCDLTELYHVRLDTVSHVLAISAIAMSVGSIAGSVLVEKFRLYADKVLLAAMFAYMCLQVSMTYTPLIVFGVFAFIQKFLGAFVGLSLVTIATGVWAERAPTVIYSYQTALIGGITVGPALAAPFLSPQQNNTNYTCSGAGNTSSTTHVQLAYVTSGLLSAPAQALLLYMMLRGWSLELSARTGSRTPSLREVLSPRSWARGRPVYGVYMALSVGVMATAMLVLDATLRTYTVPLALRAGMGISKLRAAVMLTVFNVAALVGRGGGGLLSLCARPQILTNLFVIGALGTAVAATVWALTSQLALWLAVVGLGLMTSPLFPAVMGWTDQYIRMSGVAMMCLEVGKGVGVYLMLAVNGHLLVHAPPEYVLYFIVGAGGVLFVMFMPAQLVSCKVGPRYEEEVVCDGPEDRNVNNDRNVTIQDKDVVRECDTNSERPATGTNHSQQSRDDTPTTSPSPKSYQEIL